MQITIRDKTYRNVKEAADAMGVTIQAIYKAKAKGKLDIVGLYPRGSIPVLIRGKWYDSQSEAARALGVSKSVVNVALRDGWLDGVGTGKRKGAPQS